MSDPSAALPHTEVIAVHGNIHRWIEPWYGAYAILGALTAGLAVISIPLVVIGEGGNGIQIGTTIAVQNLGDLFAPAWGMVADRTRSYRAVFFAGFALIGLGFLGFTVLRGFPAWLACGFLIGFGTGASNTVASLFVVEFTPKEDWSQRISWLQTFNALGSKRVNSNRAEAMHSWLTRVASRYSMNPRQLLRALRVKPSTVRLGPLRRLALNLRSMPSQEITSRASHAAIRPDSVTWIAGPALWQSSMIAGSCSVPAVYRMTSPADVAPYERSLWRLAIRTVCPTHRCCLRSAKSLPSTAEQCQWLIEKRTTISR